MRIAPAIVLNPEQRSALEQRARSRSLPARVVERARIVLLAAENRQDKEVAAMMEITPKKAARWRQRVAGPSALLRHDRDGGGEGYLRREF
jgi:Homeodomain-like domain